MKTSQKIRCQPITTKKRASKKGLVKTELEIPSFPSFRFWPYTEIENSENSEIFSRLLNFKGFVLFEISEVSEFIILTLIPKSKTRKTQKFPNPSNKQIHWNLRLEKISEFFEFSILV